MKSAHESVNHRDARRDVQLERRGHDGRRSLFVVQRQIWRKVVYFQACVLVGAISAGVMADGTKNGSNACETYSAVSDDAYAAAYVHNVYGHVSGYSHHHARETATWTFQALQLNRGPVDLDGGYPPQWRRAECDYLGYDPEYCFWDDYECSPYNTPIIVPLTRAQNYKLTDKANGVAFDIDGDGALDQVAWTAADSRLAFLAIDRNGNDEVDSGKELFGDVTLPTEPNGFAALQAMNEALNGGKAVSNLNADEPLFAKLLLWEDRNHNGVSEPQELQAATNVVAEIGLGYMEHRRRDRHGNLFRYRGWAAVRTAPGRNDSNKDGPAAHYARVIDLYDVVLVK